MLRLGAVILAAILTSSCVNLYGALLAPKHFDVTLADAQVLAKKTDGYFANLSAGAGPYLRVTLATAVDLQQMESDRRLNLFLSAWSCAGGDASPTRLVHDPALYVPSGSAIDPDANSGPGPYHGYINLKWDGQRLPHYDLAAAPEPICLRVEGETGPEEGNLISYQVSSNTLVVPAGDLSRLLDDFRGRTR